MTPVAPPGTYTVRLKVGVLEFSQPLVVLKDPNAGGSEAGIREQVAMVEDLRATVDSVVDLIDEIEWIRAQIQLLEERVADRDEIREARHALEHQLIDLKMMLFDGRMTGGTARQDTLRWPEDSTHAWRAISRVQTMGPQTRPARCSTCSGVSWKTTSDRWRHFPWRMLPASTGY